MRGAYRMITWPEASSENATSRELPPFILT